MKDSVYQQVAEGVAIYVAKCLAAVEAGALATGLKRAATSEVVMARECLMKSPELVPLDQQRYEQHVKPIAEAVCHDVLRHGVPHSFVAPTWQREGATAIGDSTASASSDGPVVRVVVFREADGRERLAVLYSPRFAAA